MNLQALVKKAGFTTTDHDLIMFTTSPDLRPHTKFGEVEVFRTTRDALQFQVTEEKRFVGSIRLSDRFLVSKEQ